MVEPDRMGFTGVRAPEEDEVRVLRFLVRARRAACPKDCRQTDDAGSVSGPIAAVDVVVAEDPAGELRRQEVHFVRRLRAAEDSGRRPAVFGQIALEPLRGAIEGLVPRGGTEHSVVANEWLR